MLDQDSLYNSAANCLLLPKPARIPNFAGQYDQALANIQRADELNPTLAAYIDPRAIIYAEKGMYEDAVNEFQKLGQQPHALGHMGNVYARMGRTVEAQDAISRLRNTSRQMALEEYEIALVYAGLGEKDQAFHWLDQAYKARDKGLTYLRIDPCLQSLHSAPVFTIWNNSLGFPRSPAKSFLGS